MFYIYLLKKVNFLIAKQKTPVEHFTVPQVLIIQNYNPAAVPSPAPQTNFVGLSPAQFVL
jgi:hypothetical protein